VVDTTKLHGEQLNEFAAHQRESNRRYNEAFEVVLLHTPAAEMSEFWRLFGEDEAKRKDGCSDRYTSNGFVTDKELELEQVVEEVGVDRGWRSLSKVESDSEGALSTLSFDECAFLEEDTDRIDAMSNPMHRNPMHRSNGKEGTLPSTLSLSHMDDSMDARF
jgi:hypothetical protein